MLFYCLYFNSVDVNVIVGDENQLYLNSFDYNTIYSMKTSILLLAKFTSKNLYFVVPLMLGSYTI